MTDSQAFADISSRSTTELAETYVALWNESDADRRRRMIADLWTQDGRHILQPPQEIREIAAQPGIAMTAILEARGSRRSRRARPASTTTGSAPRGSPSACTTTPNALPTS